MRAEPQTLMAQFRLTALPPLPAKPEIRPTDAALVIDAQRRPALARWGFKVAWDSKPLINARSESVAEKPTFRRLLNHRIVVPATAYWEWRKDNGARHKMKITAPDGEILSMAGLIDGETFTILTRAPIADIAFIHSRMPVLLNAADTEAWLQGGPPQALCDNFTGPLRAEEDIPHPRTKTPQGDLFS